MNSPVNLPSDRRRGRQAPRPKSDGNLPRPVVPPASSEDPGDVVRKMFDEARPHGPPPADLRQAVHVQPGRLHEAVDKAEDILAEADPARSTSAARTWCKSLCGRLCDRTAAKKCKARSALQNMPSSSASSPG